MKKHQVACLISVCVLAGVFLVFSQAALANEPIASNVDTAASTTSTNGSTANSQNTAQGNSLPPPSLVQKKPTLTKKVFSVATAFFVGTPVCVVRRSKYEEWYGVHGMIGESDSKVKKFLAGTFWLPFAVADGVLEAPFDAAANGLMYPAFSKDQLSQGKLVQNN